MPSATLQHELEPVFSGQLICPADDAYAQARAVWNGDIDKRPALIARCAGPRDVKAALAYARKHDLQVAVRGGGHSPAGYSSCDGGIVIDVGPMKNVEIDAGSRTGRFGAGLRWGELDAATQQLGLAVTGGRVTHTGIAGLTLGSGSGWLERKHGMTAASLLAAEVVTADGHIVHASERENQKLLWGLRGGGGNFGIVTEFEFRLHGVGPMIFGGQILHPRAAAPRLIRFYRDFIEQAPDEVGGGFALMTAPAVESVPEAARGMPACGLILVYAGDPERGREALRPLIEWGEPLLRRVGPMPYTAVQSMTDASHPWGIHHYAKVGYAPELSDQAADTLIAQAGRMGSPFSQLLLQPLGGEVARMDRSAMALDMPDAKWAYFVFASWWDSRSRDEHIAWARGVTEAMGPWSVDAAPLNFISLDDESDRLRRSYGGEKFERLVALKDRYDPDNVLALNQNIPPTASPSPANALRGQSPHLHY